MLCVQDPAGGGLVSELLREVFPGPDGILEIEVGIVDEVSDCAIRKNVGHTGIQNFCDLNVRVKGNTVINLSASAAANGLHGTWLGPATSHDCPDTCLMVHEFHESPAS